MLIKTTFPQCISILISFVFYTLIIRFANVTESIVVTTLVGTLFGVPWLLNRLVYHHPYDIYNVDSSFEWQKLQLILLAGISTSNFLALFSLIVATTWLAVISYFTASTRGYWQGEYSTNQMNKTK